MGAAASSPGQAHLAASRSSSRFRPIPSGLLVTLGRRNFFGWEREPAPFGWEEPNLSPMLAPDRCRSSCYLFGRERRVADVPTDHPSCSKQHAVLQFRWAAELLQLLILLGLQQSVTSPRMAGWACRAG